MSEENPSLPSRAVAKAPSGSPARSEEKIFFEGIAKHSANLWSYAKWIGSSLLGGAIAMGIHFAQWFPDYSLYFAVLWFVGLPGLGWSYLVHVNRRYKIGERRVEIEHGVLTKRVDSLELWRVLDLRYEQSLIDRILGDGKVTLIATDQSHATLELHGLPGHRKIFEDLRDAVQEARRSNRPMELVPGQEAGEELIAGTLE